MPRTSSLTIVDTDTLQVRTTIATDSRQTVALSPTGDRVAVAGEGHITIRSTADGTTISTIPLAASEAVPSGRMSWIDATQLFITPTGGYSRVIDTTTGATTHTWGYTPTGLAVADGNVGVYSDFPTSITSASWGSLTEHTPTGDVVDTIENLKTSGVVKWFVADVVGASYSQDGRWMAVGTNQSVLLLRRHRSILTPVALAVQPPVTTTALFSADGTSLAAFAATGQVVIYDLSHPGSIVERTHLNVGGGSSTGFFSPASKSLFVIAGGRLLEVALDNREPLATATFGRDGQIPFTARSDGTKVIAAFPLVAYDPRPARRCRTMRMLTPMSHGGT